MDEDEDRVSSAISESEPSKKRKEASEEEEGEEQQPEAEENNDDNDDNNDNDDGEDDGAQKEGNAEENAQKTDGEGPKKKRAKNSDPNVLKFPLSRVRQILQLDDELGKFRRESVMLIAKATELFVAFLTEQALHNTQAAGRKLLKPEDVQKAIQDIDTLEFLRGLW